MLALGDGGFLVAIQWLIGRTTNFLQRGAYIWSVHRTVVEEILAALAHPSRSSGHHLWLQLNRSDFVSHVLRDGLAVAGGDAFAVGENAPLGVRVYRSALPAIARSSPRPYMFSQPR